MRIVNNDGVASHATGMQIQGWYPTLNLNNYWNGTQNVAIGTGYTGSIGMSPASGAITLDTGPNLGAGSVVTLTPAVTILNNGNVGIGTAAMTQLLTVNGNVDAMGSGNG